MPTPTGTSVTNGLPDRVSDSHYVAIDDLCLPKAIFVAHPHLQDARTIATAIVRQPRRPPRQVDSSWIRRSPRYTSPPFSTSLLLPPLEGKWYMPQVASKYQPLRTYSLTLASEDYGPNLLPLLLNFSYKGSRVLREAMRELICAQKRKNRCLHQQRTYRSPRLRPEPIVPTWLVPLAKCPQLWLSLANRKPFYLAQLQHKILDLKLERTTLLGRFIHSELTRVRAANHPERIREVEKLIYEIKTKRHPYMDSPYTYYYLDTVMRSMLGNFTSPVEYLSPALRKHVPKLALIPTWLNTYLSQNFPSVFAAPVGVATNVYEIVNHHDLDIVGNIYLLPPSAHPYSNGRPWIRPVRFHYRKPRPIVPINRLLTAPVPLHPQMFKTVAGVVRNLADPNLVSNVGKLVPLADELREALPTFTRTSATINTQLPDILAGASVLAGSINTAAEAISSIKTFLISFIPKSRATLLNKVLDLATLLYDWIICVRSSTWGLLITLAIRTLNLFGIYATDLIPRLLEYLSIESLQNLISKHPSESVIDEFEAYSVGDTPVQARKQVGYTGNIVSFFVGLIGCVVTGSLLPAKVVKGASDSLRNLPAFQDLATWTGDTLQAIFNLLPEAVNFWFKDHFPFAKWIAEYLDSKRSLWKMVERIDELNTPESIRQMSTDSTLQKEILELDERMRAALIELSQQKGSTSTLNLLRDYAKKLTAYREIVYYCLHSPSDRMEPFCLWLYGEAGVGKTFISDQIIRELCPPSLQHNRVYQWTSQAYKEGYTGQFCWKMEDLGLIDRPNQKSDPHLDFCQAVQTAVWPLEMASAEKKDKVFFSSPLVCVTSNMAYIVPNGMLAFGQPLKRRRHILAQITSHPDYVDARGRLDMSKFPAEPFGFTGHLQYTIMDKYDNVPHEDYRDADGNANVYSHAQFMKILRTQFVRHTRREHDRMMYNARLDKKAMDPKITSLLADCERLDINDVLIPVMPVPITKQMFHQKFKAHPSWNASAEDLSSPRDTLPITSLSDSVLFSNSSYTNPYSTAPPVPQLAQGYLSGLGGYATGSHLTAEDFWDASDTASETEDELLPLHDLSLITERHISEIKSLPLGDQIKILQSIDEMVEEHIPKLSFWRKYLKPALAVAGLLIAGISAGVYMSRRNQRSEETLDKQNGAYNSDPRHTPKVRTSAPVRAINAKKQAADIGTTLLMTGIFRKSTFTLVRQGGVAHAIAVKGTNILTCAHFFFENDVPLSLGTILELRSSTGAVYTEFFDPERLYLFSNGEGKSGMPIVDSDCALYRCSLNTTTFRDITSHFVKEDDLEFHDRINLSIVTTEPTGDYAIRSGIAFARTERRVAQHPVTYSINKDTVHTLQSGWIYPQLRTLDGDCGAMLVADEATLVRKIVGIHVACHPNISRFQTGYGELVTQEMLLALIKLSESDFGPSILPALKDLPIELISEDIVEAKKQAQIGELEGNFNHVGRVSRKDAAHQSTKPSHIPSPIHGMVFPVTKGPSVLSQRDPRATNLFESPIRKGCAKYGKYTRPLNIKHVEQMSLLWTDILKPLPFLGPRRVLTIDEAVTGLDYPGFEAVVAKTSPGYPWTKFRPSGATGKTHLLTTRESDGRPMLSSDEVRSAVEERIGNAKAHTRTPTLCVSTLKAELRSLEKIRDGKTRIFTVMPFDYTIAFRQYFLAFTAFLMQNLFAHSSCVGINPESPDWNQLADILLENSPHITAADYKDWDGIFYGSVIYEFAEIASRWYDDGEENRNIRRVLIVECCKTYHLALDYVFETVQGMPSGNPATALINSIGNFIYHGCAYLRLAPPALRSTFHFRSFVRCFTYGDDNILSIAPEIIDFYNFNTISLFFLEHNIEYTLPDKSDGEQPPYAPLQFWSFLKRRFGKQYSMWVPLMDENTINSNTNFITPSNDDALQCNVNCNEALKFAYWYGREYFDSLRSRIESAMITQHVQPALYDFAAVSALYSDPSSDYSKLAQNVVIRLRKQVRSEESPYTFTLKAFTICTLCKRFKNCTMYEWRQPAGENYNPMSLILCTCLGVNKELARPTNSKDCATQTSPSDLHCHPCDASTETDFSEVHLQRTYSLLLGSAKTKVVDCDEFSCEHAIVFASTHYGVTYPVTGIPQSLGSLFDATDSLTTAYRFRHRRIAETGTSRPNMGLEVCPVATQPDPFPNGYYPPGIKRRPQDEAVKTVYLPVRRIILMQDSQTQVTPTEITPSIRLRKQMQAGATENSGGTILLDQAPPGESLPPAGVSQASSATASQHHADQAWTLNAMAEKLSFVGTFPWTTAKASGDSLLGTTTATKYLRVPQSLLTTVTNALGFTATTFWRGDVEIEFRVNGSIFHVGTLCAFYVPLSNPSAIEAWQGSGPNAKQCQSVLNSILMDASDSTTATLRIPWFHQIDRMNNTDANVATAQINYNYLGHVGLVVWNPLLAATSGSQSINVSIFARFVNNVFTVPTGKINPVASAAPSYADRLRIFHEIEDVLPEDTSELSSEIDRFDAEELRCAVREMLAKRPTEVRKQMLSALAIGLAGTAGGIVARHAAQYILPKTKGRDATDRSSSGYDKPVNPLIPPVFTQNAFDYMSYDSGLGNAQVLDIKSGQQQRINAGAASASVDELSVKHLTSKFTLVSTLTWTTTNPSGYQFPDASGTRYITPFPQGLSFTLAGGTLDSPPVAMLHWVSRFGTFWSGSIKLRFRIVCAKLAQGRIIVGAHYGQLTPPTSIAQITGQFAAVVDLQKDKHEFDFVLNANSTTALKRIPNGPVVATIAAYAEYIYGCWSITVDNPLIVPSDLPTTAYINIFVAAGDDFKLYTPSLINSSLYSIYMASAVGSVVHKQVATDGAVESSDLSVAPQEAGASIAIAATPGNVSDGSIAEITSLRDLIRRFSNLGCYPLAGAATFAAGEPNVYYDTSIASVWYIPSTPMAFTDDVGYYGYFPQPQHKGLLSQIAMMFRGYVGGLNYNIAIDSPTISNTSCRPIASYVPECTSRIPFNSTGTKATTEALSNPVKASVWAATQLAFGYARAQGSAVNTAQWLAQSSSPPPLAVNGPYVPQLQVQVPGLTQYNFFLCGADRPPFPSITSRADGYDGWNSRDFTGQLIVGATVPNVAGTSAYAHIFMAAADDMCFFNLVGIPIMKINATRLAIPATGKTLQSIYPDRYAQGIYTLETDLPETEEEEEESFRPHTTPLPLRRQMNTGFHRPGYASKHLLPTPGSARLRTIRDKIAAINIKGDKTALSTLSELHQYFEEFFFEFETARAGGVVHEPLFLSVLHFKCGVLEYSAKGEAHSKKAAEQKAAAGILALLVGAPSSVVPMIELPDQSTTTASE